MAAPERSVAIILGVSECPAAPKLGRLPQCQNSASEFKKYTTKTLGIHQEDVLDLFDNPAAPSDQLEKIEDWITDRINSGKGPKGPVSNLFVFYSGHGGFTRSDQSYFLATRRTRAGSEGATSIRYVDFSSSLKRYAASVRRYLILDCCFAAASVLPHQSEVTDLVNLRIEESIPGSGTAVLCSSASSRVSIAPRGARFTMFSEALFECLKAGSTTGQEKLNLEQLVTSTQIYISGKYEEEGVRPELHVPDQAQGNPAKVPLFPNAVWSASSIDRFDAQVDHHRLREVTASVTQLAGLLSGIITAWIACNLENPWGLFPYDENYWLILIKPYGIACNGLALSLTLSVFIWLVAICREKRRVIHLAASGIGVFLAWIVAHSLLLNFVKEPPNFLFWMKDYHFKENLNLGILAGFAGALGAIGILLPFYYSDSGRKASRGKFVGFCLPISVGLCFITAAVPFALRFDYTSLIFGLALFPAWHLSILGGIHNTLLARPPNWIGDIGRWVGSAIALSIGACFILSRPDIASGISIISGEIPRIYVSVDGVTIRRVRDAVVIGLEVQAFKTGKDDLVCRVAIGDGSNEWHWPNAEKAQQQFFLNRKSPSYAGVYYYEIVEEKLIFNEDSKEFIFTARAECSASSGFDGSKYVVSSDLVEARSGIPK